MKWALLIVVMFVLTAGCIEEFREASELTDKIFFVLMGWEDVEEAFPELAAEVNVASPSTKAHDPTAASTPQLVSEAPSTPFPIVTITPTPEEDLERGSFEVGRNWSVTHRTNVDDDWEYGLFLETGGEVLRYARSNSRSDGGAVLFGKESILEVGDYSEVIVRGDVQLVDYTLRGSGWWCEEHDCDGDWPAEVKLIYIDENNIPVIWWVWGFLHEENTESKTNYEIVPRTGWHSFETPNLMDENPKPVTIRSLAIGGEGWDFRGAFRNVEIVADGKVL